MEEECGRVEKEQKKRRKKRFIKEKRGEGPSSAVTYSVSTEDFSTHVCVSQQLLFALKAGTHHCPKLHLLQLCQLISCRLAGSV